MQLPVQITFRDMQPSPAVEERIRRRVAGLERFHEHIMSCRVVVECHHHHHHHGNLYHVRVDLGVAGGELVASREPAEQHSHEDVHVAVRDAFDAITRQLEDFVRRRRGDVKHHSAP